MLPTDNIDYSPAPLRISVYLDGSQTSQGAGYGYAVYFSPILVTKGHGPAGPRIEVYDAEIMGAVEGLRAALEQPCIGYSTHLVILLDNLAAASLLTGYRPTPHRHGLSESFSQLAAQWMEAPSTLTMPRKPLQVRWIPGHSGIAGNELADKLAKLRSFIYSPNIPPSPAYLQQEAKILLRKDTYTVYDRKAPQAYKTLNIRPHIKESRSREHKLPRWVLGRLVAAHTGHGGFTAYHQQFNYTDYLESCSYGKTKTPVHFFCCPYTRKCWNDR
jgi:ribonuclease HI